MIILTTTTMTVKPQTMIDNFEGRSHSESDSLQQLNDLKSNKIVGQKNQILISEESSNSIIVTTNTNDGLTSTSTPLHGLFLQCLHATVIIFLCLHCLCVNISTVIYLFSSS